MGVVKGSKPRKEVLKGDLDDAIFAADFGDLISGKAPKVNRDAATFFQNTHPARQLCKVIESVFARLANPKEGGATIRLSTGFGGGKTHTLMALWHLANNIGDHSMGTELLPAAGRPSRVNVVAVDAAKAGVPEFSSHDHLKLRSLWGEIFYQLGGEKAYRALGKADDPEASPSESQLERVFPKGPVLILLDEIVIYMAKLSERGQGNLLGFLNSLASVTSKRSQTVMVVTDPAGQAAYAGQSARMSQALASAATRLDEIFGRKMTDFDPIGEESARVIVRRLFDEIKDAAAQSASASYFELYARVAREWPGLLPPKAASAEYAKLVLACYPFHPRLLDTARDRLGAVQDFQKSRGVLRLFARIIRDVWESGEDPELISAGEVNFANPSIQADLLQRLNRDNFKAAVTADIEKHAGELDGGKPRGIHRRVASALLLESLPMQPQSGMDAAELTLAVLRPDEAGPEPSEALDRLVGTCWHTYPMPGGRGWQFRYDPNIIKQIEERKGQIPIEDARNRVLSEAQQYFSGPFFRLAPWPSSARQVPDSADLQLVLCEDERMARAVCAYSDNSNPEAPLPRRFQNVIIAVTATPSSLSNAISRAQELLALEAIERENRSGESARLVRDQLQRIRAEYQRRFRIQTCRAFDRIVLSGGNVYTLEEQYQVPEDRMLQRAEGQGCLRKFLESNGLIYQPGDALDEGRFMKDILPGATPVPEMPGVYSAKAVHERFLSAQGLRLIPDSGVVRQTILESLKKGRLVVKLPDGRAFDNKGCVGGRAGNRRRLPGMLTTLPLEDNVYLTRADSTYGVQWLKEDEASEEGSGALPPPPPPIRVSANNWEKVVEYARERPLLSLKLIASTPADAGAFMALVQPLGAEAITISVNTGGSLKDGGNMQFVASGVRPAHPARPLTIAQTVYNSLAEGSFYEAELQLDFGTAGRFGMESQLRDLSQSAPEAIRPEATFDKPAGDRR